MLFFHQTFLLLVEEMRDLFFRKRVVLGLLLYGLIFSSLFYSLAKMETLFENKVGLSLQNEEFLFQIISELRIPNAYEIVQELGNFPILILVFQLLVVMNLPLIVPFMSNDMLTTDIYRGTLRFLTLRSSRLAYYVSKLLAHVLLYLGIVGLTYVALLIVVAVFHTEFLGLDYLWGALDCLVATLPFIFGLVAGTQLISSICKKPFTALFMCELFWVLNLFILGWEPETSFFHASTLIGTIIPMSSYTPESALRASTWGLGFFTLGYLWFLKREI